MSDHVTLRIAKPRITLYGVLVTAIIGWGVYSIFWRKPAALAHRPVLPPHLIAVPTPESLQRSAACAITSQTGSVSKTLTAAANQRMGHVTREFHALNRCASAAGSAPAAKR